MDEALLERRLLPDVTSLSDLILIARSIDDPLREIAPGTNLDADITGDGVIDKQDMKEATIILTDLLGPEALGKLSPTYFDEDPDWVLDPSLNGTDNADVARYLSMKETIQEEQANDVWKDPEWLSTGRQRMLDEETCTEEQTPGANSPSRGDGGGWDGERPTFNWDVDNCGKHERGDQVNHFLPIIHLSITLPVVNKCVTNCRI